MKSAKRWSKKLLAVLFSLALTFGLILSGCASLLNLVSGNELVETETSKMFLEYANELLLARDNGLVGAQITASFAQKFPGIGFIHTPRFSSDLATFTYEGKEYQLDFASNNLSGDGAYRVLSATSCKEKKKKEKQ